MNWEVDVTMLNIVKFGLILLILTAPRASFGQERTIPVNKFSGPADASRLDSTEPSSDLLPPLRLRSTYEGSRTIPETPPLLPRTGSWLAEPGTGYGRPPSLILFFESLPTGSEEAGKESHWLLDQRGNLLSPMELDLQASRSTMLWRSIFGAAEAGGVAYMLYLHVKRYGVK